MRGRWKKTTHVDWTVEKVQKEIDRIDAGGDAWLDADEVVKIEVKRPLDIVVPVRLSSETWHALHGHARELGVGPSTLVRMWVLEKLREQVPAAQRQ